MREHHFHPSFGNLIWTVGFWCSLSSALTCMFTLPCPQMPPTLHFLGPSSLSRGVTKLSQVHLAMFLTSFDWFSGISLINGKQLELATYQMPEANIGDGENISVFLSSEGRLRVGVYSEEALLWPSNPNARRHLTCTYASSNHCQAAHANTEMHFVINLGNKHPKGPECSAGTDVFIYSLILQPFVEHLL